MAFGKYIGWLWGINICLLVVMLAASFTVDGNGRFFGMDETASYVAIVIIVVPGSAANGLVAFLDKKGKHRVLAAVIAAFYLLMLIPAFI